MGSSMYLIELNTDGFENIPKSIYWAIVTLTTVGYGDIVPTTNLGQMLEGNYYDYGLWNHCSSYWYSNFRIKIYC